MKTQEYYVDRDDLGYSVCNSEGTLATFTLVDDAFNAMREFQGKNFPENWQKVPPSIRHAKQQFYGAYS